MTLFYPYVMTGNNFDADAYRAQVQKMTTAELEELEAELMAQNANNETLETKRCIVSAHLTDRELQFTQ